MKLNYRPGYYIDQTDDLAVVYPDGSIEVLTYWGRWESGGEDGFYFNPKEFLAPL